MSEYAFEYNPPIKNRYSTIDALNERSFWLQEERSFDTYLSVHSVGEPRNNLGHTATRFLLAGNLSPLGPFGPAHLSEEERIADAKLNEDIFLKSVNIEPNLVRLLNPDRDYSTPLSAINVDEQPVEELNTEIVRMNKSGDFLYSYNQDIALAARPADCPVLVAHADTLHGPINLLVHYAWKGAASGYVKQTGEIFDILGVDRTSLRGYLSPGAHAENYPYTNYPHNPLDEYPGSESLFTNVHRNDDRTWSFRIDTPMFVYQEMLKLGIPPEHVFCDTSDTGSLDSGYSSHGRSMRLKESNTRDLFIARFRKK